MLWFSLSCSGRCLSFRTPSRSFSFTTNTRLSRLANHVAPLRSFREQIARTSEVKSFAQQLRRPSVRNQVLVRAAVLILPGQICDGVCLCSLRLALPSPCTVWQRGGRTLPPSTGPICCKRPAAPGRHGRLVMMRCDVHAILILARCVNINNLCPMHANVNSTFGTGTGLINALELCNSEPRRLSLQ